MFNPYLNKESKPKDSYERYTDERYCTKKMVRADMGGLTLIDGIWKSVKEYRFHHYCTLKSLFNRGQKPFHLIQTDAILRKIEELTAILNDLEAKLAANLSEDNMTRFYRRMCGRGQEFIAFSELCE